MFIKEQQSIVLTHKFWGCVFTNIILMLCQYCDQWIRTLLNPLSTYHGTIL